jgi:fluoride exporter
MAYKFVGLAIAGACGALARYWLGGLFQRSSPAEFPWGTLAVNALGCFLFGLIWTATQQRFAVSGETRTILLVGFLGAFTTFSSFVFETNQMIEHGEWLMASLNLTAQLGLGWIAFLSGAFLARLA